MKLTEKVEAWLAKSNDFEYLFQQFNLEFGPRPNSLDKLPPQLCPACHILLSTAITLRCGHSYCPECSRNRSYCLCGAENKGENTRKNIVIGNTIQQIFPNDSQLPKMIGESVRKDDASLLEKLIKSKLLKDDKYCHLIQARHHLSRGDYSLALVYLNFLIKEDPNIAIAWCYIAEILAHHKQYLHAITRLIISHWLDPFVPFSEDFKKSIFKKLKSSSQQNLVQENGLLEPPSKKKRKIDSEQFEVLFLSETQAGKQTENHLPITSEDCIENIDFEELRPIFVSPEIIQNTENHLTETVSALRTGDLECPLCLRIYWDPDVTPCGHTFCSNCLERTLDHDPKCPLCKQSLVEFLELRQGAKREDFTDKQLTRIIRRWLPEEHQDRFEAAREEEQEMLLRLPIFVCTLAFPGVPCPLHVFEPRHRLLLRRCIRNRDGIFGMNLPRNTPGDIPFERIGTKLKVRSANYFRDGRVVVESEGVGRFKVKEVSQVDGYDSSTYTAIIDNPPRPQDLNRLADLSNKVHDKANEWFSSLPEEMSAALVRHFGPMPPRTDDHAEFEKNDGPAWPWWVLAVIPAEDKIKMHVLAQTSLLKRLTLMSRVIACIINNQGH